MYIYILLLGHDSWWSAIIFYDTLFSDKRLPNLGNLGSDLEQISNRMRKETQVPMAAMYGRCLQFFCEWPVPFMVNMCSVDCFKCHDWRTISFGIARILPATLVWSFLTTTKGPKSHQFHKLPIQNYNLGRLGVTSYIYIYVYIYISIHELDRFWLLIDDLPIKTEPWLIATTCQVRLLRSVDFWRAAFGEIRWLMRELWEGFLMTPWKVRIWICYRL